MMTRADALVFRPREKNRFYNGEQMYMTKYGYTWLNSDKIAISQIIAYIFQITIRSQLMRHIQVL